MRGKVPLRVRILAALSTEPDWDSITPDQIIELREAQNRKRVSAIGRLATGKPDRGARKSPRTHSIYRGGGWTSACTNPSGEVQNCR